MYCVWYVHFRCSERSTLLTTLTSCWTSGQWILTANELSSSYENLDLVLVLFGIAIQYSVVICCVYWVVAENSPFFVQLKSAKNKELWSECDNLAAIERERTKLKGIARNILRSIAFVLRAIFLLILSDICRFEKHSRLRTVANILTLNVWLFDYGITAQVSINMNSTSYNSSKVYSTLFSYSNRTPANTVAVLYIHGQTFPREITSESKCWTTNAILEISLIQM